MWAVVATSLWLRSDRKITGDKNESSPLEDIKNDLITTNRWEREVATHRQINTDNVDKLKSDIRNYVLNNVFSLAKQMVGTKDKEKILDILIVFFSGIGDVFDINDVGLKSELDRFIAYKDAKKDIEVKQQRVNKRKRVLIQTHIRKTQQLTYGLNSSIMFRSLYRTIPEIRTAVPLQFHQSLESIERVADKFLTEMLNNLDKDWSKIIKVDMNEL